MESLDKDKRWIKSMEFCHKYFGCHQMPERSFFIHEYQMPLCARCTGILIGHVVAILTGCFIDIPYKVLSLVIPMAVDGGVQYTTKYRSTNARRLVTGIMYGFAITTSIFHTVRLLTRYIKCHLR